MRTSIIKPGVTTQTVNQAASATTVSSSMNPAVFGQAVTFTATISAIAPGVGVPTGTVTFLDGTATLGSATLDATGHATLSTSSLTVGSHSIQASYSGDTNWCYRGARSWSSYVPRAKYWPWTFCTWAGVRWCLASKAGKSARPRCRTTSSRTGDFVSTARPRAPYRTGSDRSHAAVMIESPRPAVPPSIMVPDGKRRIRPACRCAPKPIVGPVHTGYTCATPPSTNSSVPVM
jgi:hypothetical protein